MARDECAGERGVAGRPGGGTVVRRVRSVFEHGSGPGAASAPASGWLVVSTYRESTQIDATSLPAPLAAYGDRIETRIRPAPGARRRAARAPSWPRG